MKITLHQLEIFSEVATQANITRAAEALHMTQPAASIQLKQLESQIGLPLIEFIGKKLFLTPAGELLLSMVKRVNEELDHFNVELSELKGGLNGTLKIAGVTSAQYFLPEMLAKFHNIFPNVKLSLKIRNREAVLERLYNNQDDLVILSQLPDTAMLHAQQILSDQLVIVANKKLSKISNLEQLHDQPWIMREQGSGTRMAMERFFQQHNFTPSIVMELGSAEAILAAVYANIGISIMPKSALTLGLETKRLHIVNIKEKPAKHGWYAVNLKNKRTSAIVKNFLKLIKDSQPL